MSDTELSIGRLAALSGVSVATLRTWGQRHGFPEADRLASGHRRFAPHHVDEVRQVVARQRSGLRLEQAIVQVRAARDEAAADQPSVFAALVARHPHLTRHRLGKSTLLALSWAIEDEVLARGARPHLFGSFQRQRWFNHSEARWAELSRVAASTYVFGDFTTLTPPSKADLRSPLLVHVAETSPVRREWAVVCDSPQFTAALTAWELPGQAGLDAGARRFESAWTFEPAAVRDAARSCARLAAAHAAPGAEQVLDDLLGDRSTLPVDPTAAESVMGRVLSNLDAAAAGR